jgi:hypothetical protein
VVGETPAAAVHRIEVRATLTNMTATIADLLPVISGRRGGVRSDAVHRHSDGWGYDFFDRADFDRHPGHLRGRRRTALVG